MTAGFFVLFFHIFYVHYLAGFRGISRGFGGNCGGTIFPLS